MLGKFTYENPTKLYFGEGVLDSLPEELRKVGKTILLIYGGGSIKKNGIYDKIIGILHDLEKEVIEISGVMPNPTYEKVEEGLSIARRQKVDFILAVGGGSTIDSAKAIAAGVPYDGDFWDYYQGGIVNEAVPLGTVVTISAAGSEGSPDSVITKEEGMYKRATTGEALRPKFTIMNPALTQTLPAFQTACGITDIIAHLYERYLTNTKEVECTDRMIEALMLTMIHEGPRVIEDPNNYDARANIMWAGMMAHNNSCGVGRTQDWTSHNIEHELSALYDCAHGAGLAVVMPAVFTYNLSHDVMRLAQVAVRVWGCQMDFYNPERTAREGIEALRSFLISIGMPKNFEELGAKEEDIEKLAYTCCYGDVETGETGGYVRLNQKDVENIYRLMV